MICDGWSESALAFVPKFEGDPSHISCKKHCESMRATPSTLVGGEGGASPSLLHTMLGGPTELCEWKMDVKFTWIPTWYKMDHISWSLGLFSIITSSR
jgi:hypothetical protein